MSAPSRLFRASGSLLRAAKSTPATISSKPSSSGRKPATAASTSKPPGSKSTGSATKPARSPTSRPTGILKLTPVSPALSNFLGGAPEVSRTDAVKKIWEHIKLHNLQNPNNKKEICCDDKLKSIFEGKDKVGFLEIAKLLKPHFLKVN